MFNFENNISKDKAARVLGKNDKTLVLFPGSVPYLPPPD